jgi:L-ascorbate metabolism protein UlaG (beta-lactamase superfamily)
MPLVEISWFGGSCVRLRGKEGTVAADAYRAAVGPTGRGLTADITTYSHADNDLGSGGNGQRPSGNGRQPTAVIRPTSLENAFALDGPGEYEVHGVLITGVRTFRDDTRGADRGPNTSFVFDLEGIRVAHLGDIGHMLTEEMVGEMGSVDVVCVPIGGSLAPARAAELVAQLDPKLVVPLQVGGDDAGTDSAMAKFLHEMGVQDAQPQPKLSITASSIPDETTTVLLEARARV